MHVSMRWKQVTRLTTSSPSRGKPHQSRAGAWRHADRVVLPGLAQSERSSALWDSLRVFVFERTTRCFTVLAQLLSRDEYILRYVFVWVDSSLTSDLVFVSSCLAEMRAFMLLDDMLDKEAAGCSLVNAFL